MVEFVNRTITGLVSVAVALAVLGALKRVPYRRDLVGPAFGLVGGVIAQIALGAIVVKTDLNPVLVQGHFVVSMVLVADAVVLHHRAGRPDGPRHPVVTDTVRRWSTAALVLAALVILTGTVVTGSGPHAGDEDAKRLPFTVYATARVHGLALIAFLAVVVAIVVRLRREGAPAAVFRRAQELLTVLVLQAAVGYTQYFSDVPALLVALHVFGASLMWMSMVRFTLELTAPVDGTVDGTVGKTVGKTVDVTEATEATESVEPLPERTDVPGAVDATEAVVPLPKDSDPVTARPTG
jgi:cytochrome c oxidase assembly protein subunit 15